MILHWGNHTHGAPADARVARLKLKSNALSAVSFATCAYNSLNDSARLAGNSTALNMIRDAILKT